MGFGTEWGQQSGAIRGAGGARVRRADGCGYPDRTCAGGRLPRLGTIMEPAVAMKSPMLSGSMSVRAGRRNCKKWRKEP